MAEDGDTAQVNHLVPSDIKERATENAEHGELSEAVRDVYRMYATTGGAETLAQLEIKLRKTRRERDRLEDKLEAIQEELGEVREREEEIQEEIREYEQETTEYERLIAELEALLHDGQSVFPSHGKVKTAASVSGVPVTDVIEDLKDRNPELPGTRFEKGSESDEPELSVIENE